MSLENGESGQRTTIALLFLLIAQAEIEAEHWLKYFCFALLKFGNTRRIN
jgi:hypothetical protein